MIPTLSRILYVEDEPDIQKIAQLALEAIGGFEVRIAATGEEALAVAAVFAPDLVMLDVMMPGMDGPETLRQLRQIPATARTPIVFMTAKVQPREIAHYRELGAIDVIAKPFDPMALPATIREIWERHHG